MLTYRPFLCLRVLLAAFGFRRVWCLLSLSRIYMRQSSVLLLLFLKQKILADKYSYALFSLCFKRANVEIVREIEYLKLRLF